MTPEPRTPRRATVPVLALTAAGVTWLLRAAGVLASSMPVSSTAAGPVPGPTPDSVPGQAITTQYGPVQVAAVVRAGRITEVRALRAPDDNPNSQRINAHAIPILRQEALDAQGADIATVAGATFTSEGYRQSLQSAIDDARVKPAGATPGTGAPAGRARSTTTTPDAPAPAGDDPAPTTSSAPTSTTTTTVDRLLPTGTAPPASTAPTGVISVGEAFPIATGPVQAQVTIANGRIVEVKALTYPRWNPISAGLNAVAIPRLQADAVETQSAAGIHAVTGATLTSGAFRKSLQSALDMAGYDGPAATTP